MGESGIFYYAAQAPTNRDIPWQSSHHEGPSSTFRDESNRFLRSKGKESVLPNPPKSNRGKVRNVTRKQYVPLTEIIANIQVTGSNSYTTLMQNFFNSGTQRITESRYIFPLYNGSTVVSFRCQVGDGPEINGVVKAKEEAQAIYDKTSSQQRIATLLHEQTPEIFEFDIANIPPNTGVSVQIVYLNELKTDVYGNGLLVTVPTSIAPRYGISPMFWSDVHTPRHLKLDGNGLQVRVEVIAEHELTALECRTHPASCCIGVAEEPSFACLASGKEPNTELDRTRGVVELASSSTVLDRDFVVNIRTNACATSRCRAHLEQSLHYPDTSALQVTFSPGDLFAKVAVSEPRMTEIILVLDRSASMWDNKIETLRKATHVFLRELETKKKHCLFNICSFGSTSDTLWPSSRICSKGHINEALKYLTNSCEADMGGTELEQGLKKAVSVKTTDKSVNTQVIILTDGEIWDRDGVLTFVKDTRVATKNQTRFFTLGIGDEVSHSLVEGIGRVGGGFTAVIPAAPFGGWEPGVVRMSEMAFAPENWECKLTPSFKSDGQDGTVAYSQAPLHIPSIHSFDKSTTYFLFHSHDPPIDSILVEGKSSSGKCISKSIAVECVQTPRPIIHHLAAKAIIKSYEEPSTNSSGNSKETSDKNSRKARDVAIQLGTRWNIVGKHTSFVGVEATTGAETISARVYEPDTEVLDLMEPSTFDPYLFHTRRSFLPSPFFSRWGTPPGIDTGNLDDGDDDDDSDNQDSGSSIKRVQSKRSNGCHKPASLDFFPDQDDDDANSGGGSGSSGSQSGGSSSHFGQSRGPSSTTSPGFVSNSGGKQGSSGTTGTKHTDLSMAPGHRIWNPRATFNRMTPGFADLCEYRDESAEWPAFSAKLIKNLHNLPGTESHCSAVQQLMTEQKSDGSFAFSQANDFFIRNSFSNDVIGKFASALDEHFTYLIMEKLRGSVGPAFADTMHRRVKSWIHNSNSEGANWKPSLEQLLESLGVEATKIPGFVDDISGMHTTWSVVEEDIRATCLTVTILSKWSMILSRNPVLATCLQRAHQWLSITLHHHSSKETLLATLSNAFQESSMTCLQGEPLQAAKLSPDAWMTTFVSHGLPHVFRAPSLLDEPSSVDRLISPSGDNKQSHMDSGTAMNSSSLVPGSDAAVGSLDPASRYHRPSTTAVLSTYSLKEHPALSRSEHAQKEPLNQ